MKYDAYGNPTQFVKHYLINLDKGVKKRLVKDFGRYAEGKVLIWKEAIYKALSKKVSPSIIKNHRQRPDDSPLPHYNTGKLRSSFQAYVKTHVTSKNNYVVSFNVKIGKNLDYAGYTNKGYKKRKDGSIPSWYGWMDTIMGKEPGGFLTKSGTQIPSIVEVMDDILSRRREL